MNPFSNPRAKRSTAFVVLLAWLLALAAGVANACLLEAPAMRYEGGVAAASATAQVSRVLAVDAAAATGPDAGSATEAPCLKVSDDGSRLAPRAS